MKGVSTLFPKEFQQPFPEACRLVISVWYGEKKWPERTTPERIYLFHENRRRMHSLLQGVCGHRVGVVLIKGSDCCQFPECNSARGGHNIVFQKKELGYMLNINKYRWGSIYIGPILGQMNNKYSRCIVQLMFLKYAAAFLVLTLVATLVFQNGFICALCLCVLGSLL